MKVNRIALAGNPNTGKSTLFNTLTGLKQHTGNWPGKTVAHAEGTFQHKGEDYLLIDLPGTYSLFSNSADEEVARDYIVFEKPDVTLVVVDGTSMERNLNLALQVLEMTDQVIICINLIDEAEKKGIVIDEEILSSKLGVPVVKISARNKQGMNTLLDILSSLLRSDIQTKPYRLTYRPEIEAQINKLEASVRDLIGKEYPSRWMALRLLDGDDTLLKKLREQISAKGGEVKLYESKNTINSLERLINEGRSNINTDIRDDIVSSIYATSKSLCNEAVSYPKNKSNHSDTLDSIFTSRIFGFPIMLLMLGAVFYITIAGANVPSSMLAEGFGWAEGKITAGFQAINVPDWLHGVLVLGLFRGTGWVISVMLPPMAIFFPIFALLENYGYLPRVAFNMDRLFKRSGGHGKQSLTMAMGFGCNAAAIISTRIIESPRERMLAILTNNFVPCNGRWPTLILLASLFMTAGFAGAQGMLATAGILIGFVLFGVIVTLAVSWVLSKTALKGVPTHYTLELPPFRRPKIMNTIVRASIDKAWNVLKRAVIVAAPASIITWILANVFIGDTSILMYFVNFLDPFGKIIGLDGFIMAAFILGLPANEIVVPILIMAYLSQGAMLEIEDLDKLKQVFIDHGWTWLTALNMMLFSLLHYPCGTTLFNIYKETKSKKWTFMSFAIPTVIAIGFTFLTATVARFFGWV